MGLKTNSRTVEVKIENFLLCPVRKPKGNFTNNGGYFRKNSNSSKSLSVRYLDDSENRKLNLANLYHLLIKFRWWNEWAKWGRAWQRGADTLSVATPGLLPGALQGECDVTVTLYGTQQLTPSLLSHSWLPPHQCWRVTRCSARRNHQRFQPRWNTTLICFLHRRDKICETFDVVGVLVY